MTATGIDFRVLDDDTRWADSISHPEVLLAGVWFLNQTMLKIYPRCPLLGLIRGFGDRFNAVIQKAGGGFSQLTADEAEQLLTELHLFATLGYSLWHLSNYHDSSGFLNELKELSKVGGGQNPVEDAVRIRGHGFLLLAASDLAKQGFGIEFVKRQAKRGQRTPDLKANRDSTSFYCEITSISPQKGDFSDVAFFWSKINEVVGEKLSQLEVANPRNGVVIVDCTPIWDALNFSQIHADVLVYDIPQHLGGPFTASASLIRYDDSPISVGLKNLEMTIRGSAVRSLILWKQKSKSVGDGFKREIAYRVLGAIDGVVFWRYFEKVLAFPGPDVTVIHPR